jgi:hypothetical protein
MLAHMRARTRTHTHTYTHAHAHAHTHIQTQSCAQIYIGTHACTYTLSLSHTYILAHMQERATKISHSNTARLAGYHGDPVLAKICGFIAGDEARHEAAYTSIVDQLFIRCVPECVCVGCGAMCLPPSLNCSKQHVIEVEEDEGKLSNPMQGPWRSCLCIP